MKGTFPMDGLAATPPAVSRAAMADTPGTLTATGSGTARVGLLEDGRGLAATRTRVDGPGRRHLSTEDTTEETVQTWVVGNRTVTSRAGAGEHLGLAANTVAMYFSPAGRARYGTPDPLPERVEGQDVWALDELDAFKAARRRRRATPTPAVGDPDELIGVDEFAALLGVPRNTIKRYVEDSIDAWERGEDALLPRPQWPPQPSPRGRGYSYRWPRGRAGAFAEQPTRASTGRPPASTARPQVADLHAVLAAAKPGQEPTARELAAALTARLGAPVTAQTVRRLRRRARGQ
jgi:hypothetical protein